MIAFTGTHGWTGWPQVTIVHVTEDRLSRQQPVWGCSQTLSGVGYHTGIVSAAKA